MGNITAKTSGEIASFMTPAKTNIKSLKVHFSPKQLGTGDPSPENVREIVGWDGVETTRCGENLFSNLKKAKWQKDTKQYESTNSWRVTDPIPVKEGEKIYFASKIGTYAPYTFVSDADDNFISQTTTYALSRTMPTGARYLRLQMAVSSINSSGGVFVSRTPFETIPFTWKRLPNEYQEVEWIESDGEQYIDLPFGFDDTDEVEAIFCIMETAEKIDDKYIVSPSTWNTNNNRFAMGVHSDYISNNKYCCAFGNSRTGLTFLSPTIVHDAQLHKWTYKNYVFSIPELGCSYDVSTITFGGTTTNLKLFYGYNANTKGKIAYYKHVKSNTSYELIPCYRKSDNEIGMYDTVSQTFYTNQGTGSFLKGNDVNKTFYGGYVDLISGELVETESKVILDGSESWTMLSPNTISQRFDTKILNTYNAGGITSNMFDRLGAGYTGSWGKWIFYNGNALVLPDNGNLFTIETFKEWLAQNQPEFILSLRTPLTHQLTPTQLSSFISQNNFWSNADYIEIEYELKETEDIQKARKKIILNQPHIESVKNSYSVSFNTDLRAPLKECKVYFEPVQEGSGDPSPKNVRNITGWNEVEVKNDDNVYSIDWTDKVGTVYGGYVDLVKGELVATNICETFTSTPTDNTSYDAEDSIYFGLTPSYSFVSIYSSGAIVSTSGVGTAPRNGLCNRLKIDYIDNWRGTQYINSLCSQYLLNGFSVRMSKDFFNLEDGYTGQEKQNAINEYLSANPIIVYYELQTPIHYQLTPQQILSLKGINNFSCGIKNDLSVRYWNYKKSNSSNIAYEAKNLTFDGTNYINTGVYLFTDENINRDFELVAEGINGSDTVASSRTIICAKHNGKSYGFLVRLNGGSYTNYNGTISLKMNYDNSLIVRRVNGVISISGDQITNPKVKFTNTVFEHPLVLGCAVDDDGTYYRYGHGTIQHIVVRWL